MARQTKPAASPKHSPFIRTGRAVINRPTSRFQRINMANRPGNHALGRLVADFLGAKEGELILE